jgi:hypothetical membrane protein
MTAAPTGFKWPSSQEQVRGRAHSLGPVTDDLRAARWGALALVVRPTYVLTELVTAAATTGGYSFVVDSVSRLGETGCTPAYCSPRHAVMNGSFLTFGALLAGGAALLAPALGRPVAGLLVVSGLSSMATGLAPLDQDPVLHAVAATPLFVAQPLALLLLGRRVRRDRPALGRALTATGVVTAAAALGFVASPDGFAATGALERLALWPVLFGLAAFAWTAATSRTSRTRTEARGTPRR